MPASASGPSGAVSADSVAAPADSTVTAPARGAKVRKRRERVGDTERRALKRNLQLMGRREVEGPRAWQRRKSGKVAMLSSALLPGLGQTYNGRRVKVAVVAGAAAYYMSNIWLHKKSEQRARARRDRLEPGSPLYDFETRVVDFHKESARDFLWWSALVWLLGILDAYVDAKLYDIRAYTPPPPGEMAVDTRFLSVGFDF